MGCFSYKEMWVVGRGKREEGRRMDLVFALAL